MRPALIAALPFPPRGKTALVLGAGGSARAAVWALLDAGAAEVRGVEPDRLAGAVSWPTISARWQWTAAEPADLLVHCTSSGLDASDWTFKQLPGVRR